MEWTTERIAALTELWSAGKTAGQIASAWECSRNTVLGKVHRLGLPARKYSVGRAHNSVPRRPTPIRPPKPAKPPKQPKQPFYGINRDPSARKAPTFPVAVVEDPGPILGQAVAFSHLSSATCRYPYGDNAPYLFCGAVPQDGSSYCPMHHAACLYERPVRQNLHSMFYGTKSATNLIIERFKTLVAVG